MDQNLSPGQRVLECFDAHAGSDLSRTADEVFNTDAEQNYKQWEAFWRHLKNIAEGRMGEAIPNCWRFRPLSECREHLKTLLHLPYYDQDRAADHTAYVPENA